MASIAELKKDFKRLADRAALFHGYILFGHDSESEKTRLAQELANYLENKKWEVGDRILSDSFIIDARQEAGIDLVRSSQHFLWQKPAIAPNRTLVIDHADRLTLPAQNAILKIAEEPPTHALIILLVRDPEVLLPALVSRFQKIFVAGARKFDGDTETAKIAERFLKSSLAIRKEIIKEILEDEAGLENFVAALFVFLWRDKIKNYKVGKELLKRWVLIEQLNVNKRLQMEAALVGLP
mgnify:FL=1